MKFERKGQSYKISNVVAVAIVDHFANQAEHQGRK